MKTALAPIFLSIPSDIVYCGCVQAKLLAAAKESAASAGGHEVRFVGVEERHASTARFFASMVVFLLSTG